MFEEDTLSPALVEPGHPISRSDVSRKDGSDPTRALNIQALRLAPVTSSDDEFLYRAYASTRREEMGVTGWNAGQQEAFLRMQYEAQRRSYLMQLPDATYSVIRCNEIAVGRLILDRTTEEIHVVDIAILPEFRGHEIGSSLMKSIMVEAAQGGKAVRLHVERFNPALQWYQRLGFSVVNSGPIYLEMLWRSASDAPRDNYGVAV